MCEFIRLLFARLLFVLGFISSPEIGRFLEIDFFGSYSLP